MEGFDLVMKTFLHCLIVALMGAGCATVPPAVQTDADPNANFSGLQTYAWDPAGAKPTDDPRVNAADLEKRIKAAVDAELANRGFELVSADPDFLMGYATAVESMVETSVQNVQYGSAPGMGGSLGGNAVGYRRYSTGWAPPSTSVHRYHEGTLALDVVNPETDELMWRGSARAEIYLGEAPNDERLREAVHRILTRFPAR